MSVKVGIDYDEPVFTWYDYAHESCVEAGLAPLEPKPTNWAPFEEYGVTDQDWYDVLNAEVRKGVHGMYARPIRPEVINDLQRLYDEVEGVEVHIITARGSFGRYGEMVKRLTQYQALPIPHDRLWFDQHKWELALELGLDYFYDDRPQHYDDLTRAGVDTYLHDAPWNQDLVVPADHRLKSLGEYVDLIIEKHGTFRA